MQTSSMHVGRTLLVGVCALWFMMAGTVSAQGAWVEELGNFLAFYQTIHPGWTGHPTLKS